jgi:hypothetical protein
MPETQARVPPAVRLALGRAAVQTIADRVGADILHIKGNAVDASVRPIAQPGTDLDVLVRPADIPRFDRELRALEWTVYSTFAFGSPFEHAQTYAHEVWGFLDLHRSFPGIEREPTAAFDLLWQSRGVRDFAGVDCLVPEPTAQATILLLNCARTPRASDLTSLWTDAEPARRQAVTELVHNLDAEVAFAAATGELDRMRGRRTYALWSVVTNRGTRAAEWRARVRAAPTAAQALRVALRAPLVNVDALAHRLGREPTRSDIIKEFFLRPATAARESVRRRSGT